jgi:hypothetical protein
MASLIRNLFVLALLCSGCSGGGGAADDDSGNDDGGTVRVQGAVTDLDPSRTLKALPNVTVCALGACDATDSNGIYDITVPDQNYAGGTVAFSFTGTGLSAQTSVSGLLADASSLEINFLVQNDGAVSVQSIEQDGVPTTPGDDDDDDDDNDDDDDDDTPLPTDPGDRACEILRRSNIAIPNTESPIVVRNSDSTCPIDIDSIVVVGNPGAIAYEYQVTIDTADRIQLESTTATAQVGELVRHNANYLCNSATSFTATVTATVTRYLPADGVPITAADAIALCGRNASVGNTNESVPINVVVTAE